MICIKIIISGIVQGVGYRYFCYRIANKLNIKGYVKNLFNGDVMLEIEGDKIQLDEFIAKIKVGPASANVKSVNIENLKFLGKFTDFKIV